jgi:branched-chain amino acid transport system substrate-binding protein
MKVTALGSVLVFSIAALACEAKVSAIDTPSEQPLPEGGCSTNADCIDANGGAAYLCTKETRTCVPLGTTDCDVYADPSDIRNDNTVWLGVVYPKSGTAATEGAQRIAAVDLARREIRDVIGTLPPAAPGAPGRPLAFVACDEETVAPREHLIEKLRVPAILGFSEAAKMLEFVEAAPRNVLLMGAGPSHLSISDTHSPLERWQTTPSDTQAALAMAKSVAAFEEAAAHARPGASNEPLRVALVSDDAAVSDVLSKNASINGKRTAEAGDAARVFTYSPASSGAETRNVAEQLGTFQPDIIVAFGGTELGSVVSQIESGWSASLRPLYVVNGTAVASLGETLRGNADLRHRTVVVDQDTSRPGLALFMQRFAAQYPNLPPPTAKLGTTYDAAYALAYSVVGSTTPIAGTTLARALPKLTTGKVRSVGPTDIFAALQSLTVDGAIDLDGVSGPLDFNPTTGDVDADMEIQCVTETGGITHSGAVFRYASGTFEGQAACP